MAETARRIEPGEIPAPSKIYLFRSCTGSLEYPGTEKAIREVLGKLGIEVYTSPDQTCCSGYMLTCNAILPATALAATARNLAIVQGLGLEMFVFCNGCFGYNTELTHILNTRPGLRAEVDKLIEPMGWRYRDQERIYHIQELLYRLRDEIFRQVIRPLAGVRVAVHYGCHYLAKKYGIIDDIDYPTFLEEIITGMGGTPVFYRERRSCCGAAVGRGFTHPEEISLPHARKKLASVKEAGADVIVTVCPGCNVQLDREQPTLAERGWGDISIPVIDFSQLAALSLGVDHRVLGFEANTVPVAPLLDKLGLVEEEVKDEPQ
ncbi:MAG: CoB--CoM heterodisulfide reductase iron-sulfur subunit B family protein [Firmicutes bacterium]|nr:CoB--CoM heterodisulfide reductase iron-sulfur subunit B family protein [Bacillota bacterium]